MAIVPSKAAGSINKVNAIAGQIPLLGEIAAQVWTTPVMDMSSNRGLGALLPSLPSFPIPLPGECEVYVRGRNIINRELYYRTEGPAQIPITTDPIEIDMIVNIKTQGDALAWALLIPILNERRNKPKRRLFLHPHTALAGVANVYITSWSIDHYTPVKGGTIVISMEEAIDFKDWPTFDIGGGVSLV